MMRAASPVALKEWAVVEEATAAGAVSLLVRKGGIHERQGDFRAEHREFWIFPTGWHENRPDLAPHLHPFLDHPIPPRERGTIPFRVYCLVDEVLRITSREALDRVDGLHPLSLPAAHARFDYKGRPYVHGLVVRAYLLPEPAVLPDTARYEGCVSWVELDRPIATEGLAPVLSDEDFMTVKGEIVRRLGTEGVERV